MNIFLLHLQWFIIVSLPALLWTLAFHYGPVVNKMIKYDTIKLFFILLRPLTALSTIVLLYGIEYHTWDLTLWVSPPFFVFIGTALIAFGTWINYLVYQRIGTDGVYYACELTGKCKRSSEFPYNYTYHPMYYASIVILVGVISAIGIKEDLSIRFNVVYAMSYIIAMYALSINIESYPPALKHE